MISNSRATRPQQPEEVCWDNRRLSVAGIEPQTLNMRRRSANHDATAALKIYSYNRIST